jgi:hypothetical protein
MPGIQIASIARVALLLAALTCCAALALNDAPADGSAKSCKRFCVFVEPKSGDTKTVFKFSGRGWRPNRRVEALHGLYCRVQQEPKVVCQPAGIVERFRANKRGRFVFRFRNGPGVLDPDDIPPPAAQGGGPVTFSQWRGRPYHSKRVRRRPLYCVDGELPGFYSKPCPPSLDSASRWTSPAASVWRSPSVVKTTRLP